MSRKLLLSSISIAAAASLIGVGAYAKFSDSEQTATHSIAAGTLDLKILNGEQPDSSYPEYAPISVTNAKPGDHALSPVPQVHFKNVGSLPGRLSVRVVMDTNAENGIVEPELGDPTEGVGELGDEMLVSIDGIGTMINQPLTALHAAGWTLWPYDGGVITPGQEGWANIVWSIPETVGNQIMSDSVSFHLEFSFEQV
jgi:predicted ribosomally synthesized peptide with SipW-like signal peptide